MNLPGLETGQVKAVVYHVFLMTLLKVNQDRKSESRCGDNSVNTREKR